MDYGKNDLWSVWIDLERIEEELKWGGCPPGFGPQYDCMGRPASASLNVGWAYEQMGRVNRVRQALADSGPRWRKA